MALGDFQLQRGAGGNGGNAVRIPIVGQRSAPQGLINARLGQVNINDGSERVAQAGMGLANSLGQAATTMAGVAQYEQQQAEQRMRLDANMAYSNDSTNLGMWYQEANQQIKPGGSGFTKDVNDAIDKQIEEAVKDKPKFYADEYRKLMLSRKSQLVQHAQIAEIQEGARYKLESIDKDVQATVNRLAQNPSDKEYTAELGRLSALVDADPQLRVDVKEKVKENLKQQLSWATSIKKAEEAAKSVPVGGSPAEVSNADGVWSRMIRQESGGKQFGKDGKPLTSEKGAIGVAQVMPGTAPEAARLAGLPYDEQRYKNDPEYNKALGKAYFDKQVQTFGGDLRKAAAAYNMGPGNAEKGTGVAGLVDKWGDAWLEHAPKETRDYVAKTVGERSIGGVKVAAGKGANLAEIIGPAFSALPFDKQQQVQHHYDQQFKQGQASGIANVSIEAASSVVASAPLEAGQSLDLPALKEQAVARVEAAVGKLEASQRLHVENAVEKQASDRERDFRRSQEADVQQAFSVLDKNGGDYQALVRDQPAVMQRIGRDGAERLQKYAGEVATGGTRATDWQAYNMLVSDPKTLATTNLDALKDKFNSREFVQLQKMQQHLKTNAQAEDNILGDKALVGSMLKNSGVTDDKKEAQFYSLLQQAIDQELAATGKKALTQERKKELAADLLVQEITSKGTLWDSKEKAFLIQVPPVEKSKIEAALREAGMPPTEYNILRAYRNKLNKPSVLEQKNSGMVKQIPY